MFRLSSSSLLWRGLLGIAIGLIAIAWPGVTVGAVSIFARGAGRRASLITMLSPRPPTP